MKQKSVHEPKAKLMSAAEVWDDAQQVTTILRQNALQADPVVRLPIPLSVFLSALDTFSREELLLVRQRIEERLVV